MEKMDCVKRDTNVVLFIRFNKKTPSYILIFNYYFENLRCIFLVHNNIYEPRKAKMTYNLERRE
jgi:hypothetical protein